MNFNFGEIEAGMYGNVEEDEELLAELAALQREEDSRQRRAAPERRTPAAVPAKKPAPAKGVDGLDPRELAAALADPSGEADVDGIENDDDLLNELSALVGDDVPKAAASSFPVAVSSSSSSARPPPLPPRTVSNSMQSVDSNQLNQLRELTKAYRELYEAAQKAGDAPKVRRLQRTLDKLTELTKKVEKGVKIDPDEIPPAPPKLNSSATSSSGGQAASVVSSQQTPLEKPLAPAPRPPPVPARSTSRDAAPVPTATTAVKPPTTVASEMTPEAAKRAEILKILYRRRDANVANGKAAVAVGDKTAALEYVTAAKQFDEAIAAVATVPIEDIDINDIPPSPEPYRTQAAPVSPAAAPSPAPTVPRPTAMPTVGEQPKTFVEALSYRQKRFEMLADKCKQEGNDRKHRMNLRMAGQYKEALASFRAGRPIEDLAELPTLPDFPPLPPITAKASGRSEAPAVAARRPSPSPGPSGLSVKPPPTVGPFASSGPEGQSRNATQLEFLLQRQTQFKQAAIAAKQHGNLEQAKKFLLESKGFDKMIAASRAGLPVDIKKTPIPPQVTTSEAALKPKIETTGVSTSGEGTVEGRDEVLATMEKALISQVRKCEAARAHFTKAGDVGKVRQLEEWALASRKDLLLIREVAKHRLKVPKFHTETRALPSIELNPQLGEDVLELWIGSLRDAPMPSGYTAADAALFVKYDFPFPHEAHQTGKTKQVNGSTSPEFGETINLQINRKARQCLRVLKRNAFKFEVYQKGGFLRSDKLLGVVEWKLEELETKATLEESAPLKEGRKAVGGLLQLRVRIREPLGEDRKTSAQQEKWLVIDA